MGSAWRDTTTVYGPAFTLASEPLAVVAGDSDDVAAWTYKALAAAAALAAALLAGRLARRRALAIAFVGWNPLLAVHLAGGGHNDAWVGALILAALALSASRRLQAGGRALGRSRSPSSGCRSLFLALRVARVAGDRPAARASAGSASRRWSSRRRDACSTAAPGRSRSSRWPGTRRSRRATRSRTGSSSSGCRTPSRSALAVAALVVGLAWLAREAARGRARLGLAACLVLVTTPYLAVWYLAWAVPLAAAEEDAVATVAVPRALRVPAAPDDPGLRLAAI